MAHSIPIRLNRVMALIALLLAVSWVPMTSHELLTEIGLIHQEGPARDHWHYGPAHPAADGIVRAHEAGTLLKAPTLSSLGVIVALAATFSLFCLRAVRPAELPLRPSTESPPGLIQTWQFDLRMALPVRAPSFAI